jgi:hypothetical protein
MRTPNPEAQEAHWRGIELGTKTAAKIAKRMIAEGWTDMKKFEAEVWRRVRYGKKKSQAQPWQPPPARRGD